MTPGERIHYHTKLWPAACLANEWDLKDDARRRQVALDCMQLVGGPLVTTSSPLFGRDEVTALFCYLEHLADPSSFDKSARWDTCRQDYRTYNRARQADWHERKLYGQGKNKLDRDRFAGAKSASGGALDDLDAEETRKRHMTFASRHQRKMRADAKATKQAPQPAEKGQILASQRMAGPPAPVPEEMPF